MSVDEQAAVILKRWVDRVDDFVELPPSSTVEKPNALSIESAKSLLSSCIARGLVPESVVPSFDGGVGFTFYVNHTYMTVSLDNDGDVTACRGDVVASPDLGDVVRFLKGEA
jgi:hypothetical protein